MFVHCLLFFSTTEILLRSIAQTFQFLTHEPQLWSHTLCSCAPNSEEPWAFLSEQFSDVPASNVRLPITRQMLSIFVSTNSQFYIICGTYQKISIFQSTLWQQLGKWTAITTGAVVLPGTWVTSGFLGNGSARNVRPDVTETVSDINAQPKLPIAV